MFFPDKIQGYREARRVLKPGGHFLFSVWDRISENEFADVVTEALAALFPHDPPRFMARTPHGYHDVEQIRQEVNAAGFGNVSLDAVDGTSKASSPRGPAIGYCQGTPLRNEIEARDAAKLEEPRIKRLRLWRGDLEPAPSKAASGHSWSPPLANATTLIT
jgi:SAM-dependent methyltransferase